ncbi:MAG: hypothetical protein JXA82_10810 [Sedimentisphaerales bacterium]|nr:hypothetical protein [Sedimentisphaerales bacterium]
MRLERNITYLMLVLVLLLLSGCNDEADTETGISAFSYLNPDGDILAILVGSKVKGWDRPAVSETKPVLLFLGDDSSRKSCQQLEEWVIRDMAWRPAHGNQLYYAAFTKIYDDSGGYYERSTRRWFRRDEGRLVMFNATSNDNVSTVISKDGYPNILSCFRWSPDGTILAGLAIMPTNQLLNSGVLAVSFDGGKTCEGTGIEMSGFPMWSSNNELYVTIGQNTIAKVSWDGQRFKIVDSLKKDFDIGLKGSFRGKPVYSTSHRKDAQEKVQDRTSLFIGDHLLYETKDPYLNVLVLTDWIAIESDKKIMLLDENFSLQHEKYLGSKTHLLNFFPDTNSFFLIEDWKTILCYDYTRDERPDILFAVDMLTEPVR